MKIVHLTAGTGNFFCGTCLRDHTLVKGLRTLGHDAIIVPLYLPLILETPRTRETPIFFGGVNVFLQQVSRIFRRTPRWFDRILDTQALLRIVAHGNRLTKPKKLGELTLSTLMGEEGNQAKELQRLVHWLNIHEKPDIICLSNALLLGFAPTLKNALRVPVICSLQGEDAFLDNLPQPFSDRCWQRLRSNVSSIANFISVSRYYGEHMKDRLKIPSERIHVVHNGIDLEGFEIRKLHPKRMVIGYLSQIFPGKGLETLVDAFLILKQRPHFKELKLHIAGSLVPADRSFLKRIKLKLSSLDQPNSIEIKSNISREEKIKFLSGLSILSVPATYGEAFGLYAIEALAAGVPVVLPRHAAFPEIIEKTQGGWLYEANNFDAYIAALEYALLNHEECEQLGEQGRLVVHEEFNEFIMARKILDILNVSIAK